MKKTRTESAWSGVILLLCLTMGCYSSSPRLPAFPRIGELFLRYDSKFEVWTYDNDLAAKRACVAEAQRTGYRVDRCGCLRNRSRCLAWTKTQGADQLGFRRVANAPLFTNLVSYVDCVKEAQSHAQDAVRNGTAALALSILGWTFSVAGLAVAGAGGGADQDRLGLWLGSGAAAAAVGLTLSLVSLVPKARASGHAVDAVNFYNDRVGGFGVACDCMEWPPPTLKTKTIDSPPVTDAHVEGAGAEH